MKTRLQVSGLVVLLMFFAALPTDGAAQFTQGPPGNPSAAGITAGTPPPAPVPPHVVAPPPSPSRGYAPFPFPQSRLSGVSDACPVGGGMVLPPHWLFSAGGMPQPGDRQLVLLTRHLSLSSEQGAKIAEVRERFYRETRDLRYDVLQKRTELRKLLSDPKADERVLLQRQREVSGLWHKLADALGQAVVEARRLLTPAQIEMLDQLPL